MARTTTGAALLLQAIAGFDPGDPRQRDVPDGRLRRRGRARAPTISRACASASSTEGFSEGVGAEPATCEAVRAAAERLDGLGADVQERVAAPAPRGGRRRLRRLRRGHDRADERRRQRLRLVRPLLGGARAGDPRRACASAPTSCRRRSRRRSRPAVTCATALGGAPYARAQNLRPWLRAAYDRTLADADVLLFPTTPFRAFRLDDELRTSERVLRGWANLANTYPTDMSGHPAITLPLAEADGLPVGVMLVGRRFDDARLLAIAATCERALGWAPAKGA